MTDRPRKFDFWRRTLAVGLGQGIGKVSQLVMVLVIARLLSQDDVNRVTFILSIYVAAVSFGGLSLHQGVVFFFGILPRDRIATFLYQNAGLLMFGGTVTSAVVFGLDYALRSHPLYVSGVFPWLALVVWLEIPTTAAPQILIARERPGWSSVYAGFATVLQVCALVLPFVFGYGVHEAVRLLVFYAALRFAFYLGICVFSVPNWKVSWDGALLRKQFFYTLPLGLSIVASSINRQVDKWIVSGFDPDNFGSYAFAAVEIPFVSILPYAVGAVLATRIVQAFRREQPELALAYFRAGASRMCLIVIPVAIGIALIAPEVFVLAYTEEHSIGTFAFAIYALILLHRVAEYGVMLRSAGDTRSLWMASITLLVSNVVFTIPLTAWLGLDGAALGTLGANVVAWLYILGRIGNVLGKKRSEVLPWRVYLVALALSAVPATVAWYSAGALAGGEGNVARLVAKLAIYALAYLGLLHVSGLKKRLPEVPEDSPAFQAA